MNHCTASSGRNCRALIIMRKSASGGCVRGAHQRRRSTKRSTNVVTAAISIARKTGPGKIGGLDPERIEANPSGAKTSPGKVIPNWRRSTRHPMAPTTPSAADINDHPLSRPSTLFFPPPGAGEGGGGAGGRKGEAPPKRGEGTPPTLRSRGGGAR